jgi:hypothetical protein
MRDPSALRRHILPRNIGPSSLLSLGWRAGHCRSANGCTAPSWSRSAVAMPNLRLASWQRDRSLSMGPTSNKAARPRGENQLPWSRVLVAETAGEAYGQQPQLPKRALAVGVPAPTTKEDAMSSFSTPKQYLTADDLTMLRRALSTLCGSDELASPSSETRGYGGIADPQVSGRND